MAYDLSRENQSALYFFFFFFNLFTLWCTLCVWNTRGLCCGNDQFHITTLINARKRIELICFMCALCFHKLIESLVGTDVLMHFVSWMCIYFIPRANAQLRWAAWSLATDFERQTVCALVSRVYSDWTAMIAKSCRE